MATGAELQSSYGLSKCFLFLDMQGAVFALGCLAFHESFDLLAAANAASILVLDIGLIFICMMFYRRASHGYSAKVPPSTALTIDREEQPGADQLSVTNVEWWPTALDLHDDAAAAEAQKDGIIQELGVLRKKLSVKRKYSASSSTHAPAACLPSQQTITMVTIPLARAHTMDMNYAVPETRVTSTFPPRPPTPLAVPEST
ncbi:hypothetical protein SYNPS1DRAFT_21524 [Syncephalis pseudoplumigaleata]|uniref:Uncharacterized protein n=1 Tax=Syncephalis pseudoplumigaleata TaxID=1712513 RepID=A0A4P9Z409_9FUNG|nr:hypothetical protein SYNPS1DRAFT_21524 [Syncephalis pseudoplumigaleata]|eukprot:RKP26782.1 hypothetical protein SYNPS1DRAFT_21524 [Syncephalis pseudoplumigaleata]